MGGSPGEVQYGRFSVGGSAWEVRCGKFSWGGSVWEVQLGRGGVQDGDPVIHHHHGESRATKYVCMY